MQTLNTTNSINGLSDRIAYYAEKAQRLLRTAQSEKFSKAINDKPYMLTADERAEIKRLWDEGKTFTQISTQTGRMRETVQRVITGKTGKAAVKEAVK